MMRRAGERGSEVVQFVVAVPLVLLVVFGTAQVSATVLSSAQLSSEITRACRLVDGVGIAQAPNKGEFIKAQIIGASTQLDAASIAVANVQMAQSDLPSSVEEGVIGAVRREGSIVSLSYDVSYRVPSIVSLPGYSDQTLYRHVRCSVASGRVVELEVSP